MSMEFRPPSLEEYQKATEWARFKYKYSFIIIIIATLALFVLIGFVFYYGHELSAHPLQFAADRLNLDCICNDRSHTSLLTSVNSTGVFTKESFYLKK